MSVLAIKAADLGDVLLVTPALQRLHHSVGPVDLVTYQHSANLMRGAPFVRRVYATDRDTALNPLSWSNGQRRAADMWFLRRLRRERYESVVFFHHLTTWRGVARWAVLSAIVGSPLRIGLDNGRGRFLTTRAVDRGFGWNHEAEYWLQLANAAATALNSPTDARETCALWSPANGQDELWASDWHRSALRDERYVVVHPGGGAYIAARRWPSNRYAQLLPLLVKAGYQPVLVGSPGECDLCAACAPTDGSAFFDMCGKTTTGQMAALIARADGFVGNDSFPMHLSAAANRPTVGIFGPTNAQAWGPWPRSRPWLRVVQSPTWCQPCVYTGHSMGRREGCLPRPCLTGVTPEQVVRTLLGAIAARRHGQPPPLKGL